MFEISFINQLLESNTKELISNEKDGDELYKVLLNESDITLFVKFLDYKVSTVTLKGVNFDLKYLKQFSGEYKLGFNIYDGDPENQLFFFPMKNNVDCCGMELWYLPTHDKIDKEKFNEIYLHFNKSGVPRNYRTGWTW